MRGNEIVKSSEIFLEESIKLLREEIIELNIKLNSLYHECIYLKALYDTKVGKYKYKRYELYFECLKLKRKIEILQSYKNKNEKITRSFLNKIIKEEVSEYEEHLKHLLKEINNSNEILNSKTLSENEIIEIKKIYRKIVKKIHPDINPTDDEKIKELWNESQDAYIRNDLKELKRIYELLKLDEIILKDKKENLKDIRDRLKKSKDEIAEKTEQLKNSFPFNKKEILNNDELLAEEIDVIKKDIEEYKISHKRLKEIYDNYEFKGDA